MCFLPVFRYQSPPLVPEYHIHRPYLFEEIAQAICFGSFVPGEECITVALEGSGGFGKTTLALYVCHHRNVINVFSNGIIFIELGPQPCDPSKILNDYYCQMTGRNFQYINNVEEEIQKLTEFYKKILVIIDDVWKVEDARPIVKAFSYCKIMVTTRIPNISIPSRKKITIGAMSLKESVSLMINGILHYDELSKGDVKAINELAQGTHQWPLLLSLIRGQLSHNLSQSNAIKKAISDVRSSLATKGLAAFDAEATPNNRQRSVRACIEVSLGLLDRPVKDKLLSFILYTGIGGSLPSRAVQCLWSVSDVAAKKAVAILKQYGLVYTTHSKQLPPYYNAIYQILAVHSVISEYIMSTIKSETVAHLSPFIYLKTDTLIAIMEDLLFQQSGDISFFSSNSEFLTYYKQKMEHIVLPYCMKEINMHVLHDPHLVLMILHNIQSVLNDSRYYHLLALFNEEIVTLINECHDALSKAQGLSRKVNLHFQLCFRIMSFDNLIPVLKEYLESDFMASTITKCVKLAKRICTQSDTDLRSAINEKYKHFKLLTKEYHTIPLEKLPKFQLYVELHKNITVAILQVNNDEIDKLFTYITSGKCNEEVQMIYANYLIKMQDDDLFKGALNCVCVMHNNNKHMHVSAHVNNCMKKKWSGHF